MLKSWDKSDSKSVTKRMFDRVRTDEALPKRISAAQKVLETRIMTLESIGSKLKRHHDLIFQKALNAQRHNMHSYAHAYAKEVAQARRTMDMIQNTRLSLEQIRIRLDTVSEVGDMIITLSPCMSLIRDLGPSIGGIMPHANESMQDFSQMLGAMMSGSSMDGVSTLSVPGSDGMSSDAKAILEEVQSTMIGAAHSAIPDIPEGIGQARQDGTKVGQARQDSAGIGRTPAGPAAPTKPATTGTGTPRIQTAAKREVIEAEPV